jgi:3-methyladenine DNA glycosylase AlkC
MPDEYERAVQILIASLGPKLTRTGSLGMAPFLYLPHVLYVGEQGLNHFEPSMTAQYELTQRFTAEFSIRPFLEHHPDATLQRLARWASDDSVHVRRLVSEGTRPRLPWAPRLRRFQHDPQPVLELLELLKDDPEPYVRRSVANNLNDIGKDHPDVLLQVARRWLKGATAEREQLVRHALRSAIKRADVGALAALGYAAPEGIVISRSRIVPGRPAVGGSVTIVVEVRNTGRQARRALIDLRVHFVKANGKSNPKVFKLKVVELAAQQSVEVAKAVSLAHLTTRKHYPGLHRVDAVINGVVQPLGQFDLRPAT